MTMYFNLLLSNCRAIIISSNERCYRFKSWPWRKKNPRRKFVKIQLTVFLEVFSLSLFITMDRETDFAFVFVVVFIETNKKK